MRDQDNKIMHYWNRSIRVIQVLSLFKLKKENIGPRAKNRCRFKQGTVFESIKQAKSWWMIEDWYYRKVKKR